MKHGGFLGAVTTGVACLGAIILGAFLALEFSDYRSARVVSRHTDTHEAIEGLYVGAAVRFRMVYEVAAAGLLVHMCPLLALALRRRWLLIVTSLGLTGFGILAVFLALVTRAPILAAAAATSASLAPLCVIGVMRTQGNSGPV